MREQDLTELTGQLGGVPLALRLAAGRLRAHSAWQVADLVTELNQTEQHGHGVTARVHRSFDLSCRHLDQSGFTLFCHLGLSPTPHLTSAVARAMMRISADDAVLRLDTLHARHLLEEIAPGRFRFHDLIRSYGADLARKEMSGVEQQSARARLLDYYTNAAEHADYALRSLRRQPAGSNPIDDPPATFGQALEWFDEELPNLMACARTALERRPVSPGVPACRCHELRPPHPEFLHRGVGVVALGH
ncbi:hypothetical protein ACH34T_40990 [Actinomadura sp. 9N215]